MKKFEVRGTDGTMMKYRIMTTMSTEIEDFFTDKLSFKKLGGQWYVTAYSGETGRKMLISCRTIEYIEDLSKDFDLQWVPREDAKND